MFGINTSLNRFNLETEILVYPSNNYVNKFQYITSLARSSVKYSIFYKYYLRSRFLHNNNKNMCQPDFNLYIKSFSM